MAEETRSTARLEARLPNDVHALLKRAAEIEETEIIRRSIADQRQIAEWLLNPPEPTPALEKAFQRRRELLGEE